MIIRKARLEELEQVYQMFREIIEQKIYYPYEPGTPREKIEHTWVNPDNLIYVAEISGKIAGAYILRPNQPGYGSHVANAAYMVNSGFRNQGIGRELGHHSLTAAKKAGYLAMQFNFVVSTNQSAVHLWKDIGFEIIGTIPEGFRHTTEGLVDAYIMYRKL